MREERATVRLFAKTTTLLNFACSSSATDFIIRSLSMGIGTFKNKALKRYKIDKMPIKNIELNFTKERINIIGKDKSLAYQRVFVFPNILDEYGESSIARIIPIILKLLIKEALNVFKFNLLMRKVV
ncbi:hypothetical protein [Caloramator sp. Dgby_cultured_2]|uniref:hypothetical protein n=1 Tax=Caloramator sp. Dgby_cultured_2 TaxID=3029174 RepID=UPI00237E1DD4|nr:hypothetical protein [Caloramator sp. Dgby_cultured_2]WDU84313.1 hypothetical protein PWK10_08520 [Caloramator sp. Dgby_cultured_2]